MVLNLWKNSIPVCANHLPERTEMKFDASGKTMLYKCPICSNTITCNDFEKILNSISKIHVKRSQNAEWGKLTGEKFTVSKVIKCEIIEQTDNEKFFISILNPHSGVKF